jgi:hypothetical protein
VPFLGERGFFDEGICAVEIIHIPGDDRGLYLPPRSLPDAITGVEITGVEAGCPPIPLPACLEDVELRFIDLQIGCAYMYVCSKRGRTLSSRSSLKKMEDMIHEQDVVFRSAYLRKTCKSWQHDQEISGS